MIVIIEVMTVLNSKYFSTPDTPRDSSVVSLEKFKFFFLLGPIRPELDSSWQKSRLNMFDKKKWFELDIYRKVASSRLAYYSVLNSFGQRSQYISIKSPLHNQ